MKKLITIICALAGFAHADMWVFVDSRFGQTNVTDIGEARLIDLGNKANGPWKDYISLPGHVLSFTSLPAWVESDGWVVSYAANSTEADADQQTKRGKAWKALKANIGAKPTKRNIANAITEAEGWWVTATTFSIYIRARSNELTRLRLIKEFELSKENP